MPKNIVLIIFFKLFELSVTGENFANHAKYKLFVRNSRELIDL